MDDIKEVFAKLGKDMESTVVECMNILRMDADQIPPYGYERWRPYKEPEHFGPYENKVRTLLQSIRLDLKPRDDHMMHSIGFGYNGWASPGGATMCHGGGRNPIIYLAPISAMYDTKNELAEHSWWHLFMHELTHLTSYIYRTGGELPYEPPQPLYEHSEQLRGILDEVTAEMTAAIGTTMLFHDASFDWSVIYCNQYLKRAFPETRDTIVSASTAEVAAFLPVVFGLTRELYQAV